MSLIQPSVCELVSMLSHALTQAGTALHYLTVYQETGDAAALRQARTVASDLHTVAASVATGVLRLDQHETDLAVRAGALELSAELTQRLRTDAGLAEIIGSNMDTPAG